VEVGNFNVKNERERPGNLGDGMQIGFHLLEIVELASHDWLNGGNVREVVGELQPEGDSLLTVLAFDLLSKSGDNRISEFVKNAAVTTRSPLFWSVISNYRLGLLTLLASLVLFLNICIVASKS